MTGLLIWARESSTLAPETPIDTSLWSILNVSEHQGAERIFLDRDLGLLSVEHEGEINWETLQEIKNYVWGEDACAIEVYPPTNRVVNNLPMRHLWRLGPYDWWPDLIREGSADLGTLRERYERKAQAR